MIFWKYAKWPLALLVVCAIVGILVYILEVDNDLNGHVDGSPLDVDNSMFELKHLRNNNKSAINFINYNRVNRTGRLIFATHIARSMIF